MVFVASSCEFYVTNSVMNPVSVPRCQCMYHGSGCAIRNRYKKRAKFGYVDSLSDNESILPEVKSDASEYNSNS